MATQSHQDAAQDPSIGGSSYPHINPRPRTRPAVVLSATVPSPLQVPAEDIPTIAGDPAAKQPKTVKVMVDGKLKNQPTGDHAAGYGRPPVKHQFQPGNKGGPGRPKGSKSQDTLLREELAAKQSVREGRTQQEGHQARSRGQDDGQRCAGEA